MKTILKTLYVIFLAGTLSPGLMAQQAILSSSNDATGLGGKCSYSVGQVAFHMAEGATGTVTEGVQQPYEILFMYGIPDPSVTLGCIVFPNPADDVIRIRFEKALPAGMEYRLNGLDGSLLKCGKVEDKETLVAIGGLSQGAVVLTILEEQKPLRTWKIIKRSGK